MKNVYCVELDKVISSYAAWGLLFGQPNPIKKSLNFQCSDPKCRIKMLQGKLNKICQQYNVRAPE